MEKSQFVQLINDNKGTIRSLCQVYFDSCEDQKDAFQDIVLQLWKSLDSFKGASKVNTWIYRVSLNTILTKKRKDTKSVSAQPIEMVHTNISAANADDNLELLHILIRSLKDLDKGIVLLYLEGYKTKEIAEILKLSTSNVTTRFNRLKSELKVKLNPRTHVTK
ncbi:RNA polymerase sigma factor [Roseivirga misakiensis]|uniref:RNA polymerase subunit sigma-70 n=1 Tax=Roseivirga misakiensis TaxID=1563681 RepID=A0A1E5T0I6_9BACT|nr:sigma-70 family RNA polymerase sigma factor [Roseivirga misakiensis]OEK04865.1 hypothetical protein BFP71_15615 [Roseivirga misakiensis]